MNHSLNSLSEAIDINAVNDIVAADAVADSVADNCVQYAAGGEFSAQSEVHSAEVESHCRLLSSVSPRLLWLCSARKPV